MLCALYPAECCHGWASRADIALHLFEAGCLSEKWLWLAYKLVLDMINIAPKALAKPPGPLL
jgi:hypothetical protein